MLELCEFVLFYRSNRLWAPVAFCDAVYLTLIVWFVLGYIVEVKEGNSIEIIVLSMISYVNWQGQEDNN